VRAGITFKQLLKPCCTATSAGGVQGGRIASMCLTDTQLLLGSSAGAVQHFDMFSGSQQLITRHGSSVTSLLAQQQQQQGVAAAAAAAQEEDWHIIVGTADGQVCTRQLLLFLHATHLLLGRLVVAYII
jgi:hypothetical protein